MCGCSRRTARPHPRRLRPVLPRERAHGRACAPRPRRGGRRRRPRQGLRSFAMAIVRLERGTDFVFRLRQAAGPAFDAFIASSETDRTATLDAPRDGTALRGRTLRRPGAVRHLPRPPGRGGDVQEREGRDRTVPRQVGARRPPGPLRRLRPDDPRAPVLHPLRRRPQRRRRGGRPARNAQQLQERPAPGRQGDRGQALAPASGSRPKRGAFPVRTPGILIPNAIGPSPVPGQTLLEERLDAGLALRQVRDRGPVLANLLADGADLGAEIRADGADLGAKPVP